MRRHLDLRLAAVCAILALSVPVLTQTPVDKMLEREVPREAYRQALTIPGLVPLGGSFAPLSTVTSTPMGVEYEPSDGLTLRATAGLPVPLFANPVKLGDAMKVVLDRMPQYEMTTIDGVINVAPKQLLHSTTHFLNRPIKKFEVKNMRLREAVWKLRQAMNKNHPQYNDETYRNSPATIKWTEKRVSLKAENATPREILNRLIALDGGSMWAIVYLSQVPPVPSIEETCVIRLIPFPGDRGTTFSLSPFRGPRGRGPRG